MLEGGGRECWRGRAAVIFTASPTVKLNIHMSCVRICFKVRKSKFLISRRVCGVIVVLSPGFA